MAENSAVYTPHHPSIKIIPNGPGRWAPRVTGPKHFLWLEIAFMIFGYFCVIFDEKWPKMATRLGTNFCCHLQECLFYRFSMGDNLSITQTSYPARKRYFGALWRGFQKIDPEDIAIFDHFWPTFGQKTVKNRKNDFQRFPGRCPTVTCPTVPPGRPILYSI